MRLCMMCSICGSMYLHNKGLEACGPGRPYAGIGEAIQVQRRIKDSISSKLSFTFLLQEYCKKEEGGRFKPVPAFTGHGIGSYFHGPPGTMLTPLMNPPTLSEPFFDNAST